MINHPNFEIKADAAISREFKLRNIARFSEACIFVRNLPYKRNPDKSNLITLFSDNCGTCSTKHALLKQLADENEYKGIKLMLGLFRMHKQNTAPVAATLRENNLDYIPEAHCYLKYGDVILDFTKPKSKPDDFVEDLIEEIEIAPDQITGYKVAYHKKYLERWLDINPHINLSLNEVWKIREQCISDLASR